MVHILAENAAASLKLEMTTYKVMVALSPLHKYSSPANLAVGSLKFY